MGSNERTAAVAATGIVSIALDALGKTFRLFWNEKTSFCNVLIELLNPIKDWSFLIKKIVTKSIGLDYSTTR